MLIITIRTDKPEAEIGLYDDSRQLTYSTWQAHRQLAESIHTKLKEILESRQKTLGDLQGVVVFKGPGSFTGLRIGFSVANALADSLKIPIVSSDGDDWLNSGLTNLLKGNDQKVAQPEYGSLPKTTVAKK